MKSIFSLFLALIFCSFTNTVEAKKKENKHHKKTTLNIPTLDPLDEKWSWMDAQIEKDFEQIESISIAALRTDFDELRTASYSWEVINIHRYEIKNGIVEGSDDSIGDFLKAIHARYPLPDLVFLYVYCDLVNADFFQTHCSHTPLFCSAKAPNTDGKIIHFIDWYYHIKKTDKGWNNMMTEIDKMAAISPWESKFPILFWRGTTSGFYASGSEQRQLGAFPRGRLVQLSLEYPDLINARFATFLNPDLHKDFPKSSFISVPHHLYYKYQITMDGSTATYPGYQWRLYSGCLNFKQDSLDTMWFYGALKPYVHYVPVQRNMEDLVEKVEWAMANDEKAKQIAENARTFAKGNLLPEHMLLYGYKVLSKYVSKMTK